MIKMSAGNEYDESIYMQQGYLCIECGELVTELYKGFGSDIIKVTHCVSLQSDLTKTEPELLTSSPSVRLSANLITLEPRVDECISKVHF